MSNGFGKIFASTYTGSMYGSGPVVFAVWGYVLANAWDGVVEVNPPLVAGMLGCSREDVEDALAVLCAPDPLSRNPDEDGRRLICENAFQYRVVSWERYHATRSTEDRREQTRQAVARHRAKKADGSQVPDEPEKKASGEGFLATCSSEVQNAWSVWLEFRKLRRLPAYKSDKALRFLAEQPDPAACVEQSVMQNWSGLFPVKNSNGKMSLTDQVKKTKKELEKRFGD